MIRENGRLVVETAPDGIHRLRRIRFRLLASPRNRGLSVLVLSGLFKEEGSFCCVLCLFIPRLLCACLKRGSLRGERCGKKEMDSIVHSHKEPSVYPVSGNECKTT